jgi:hypothetical protein
MRDSPGAVPGDQYLGGLLMFVYRTIRANVLLTIVLPVIAMAIAYTVAVQLPSVSAAQGTVRIGRVDGAETASLPGVVSRINSLPFKQRLIQALQLPSNSEAARLVAGSISAKQEAIDTMNVSVRAPVSQQAANAVRAMVSLLDEEQRSIRDAFEANIKEQLAGSDATIAGLLENQDSLTALMKESSKSATDEPTSAALQKVWLSDLVSRNQQRLATAKAERNALVARLGTWRTYPTALIDDVFVSSTSVFPKPAVIALLVGCIAFAGLFISTLFRRP